MLTEDNELSVNPEEVTPTYQGGWSAYARRITVVVLIIGFVAIAALLLPVLRLVVLALILAFILSYPVRAVESRTRLSYSAAAGVVYLLYLLAGVALFLYLAVPAIEGLANLATQLGQELPSFVEFLENYTPEQGWLLDPETGEELINVDFILEPLSRFARGGEAAEVEQAIGTLVEMIPAVVFTVVDFVTVSIVVHIMAFFFLLESPTIYEGIMGRIPAVHRPEYRTLTDRVLKVWVSFFRGTVASAGLVGLLTGIQLFVMGIPGALILGLLLFVTSLIPVVGGFISVPVLVFVTLTQGSTLLTLEPIPLTILVVVIQIAIGIFVWQVFYPRQTGKTLNLPASLVIVGLTVGAAYSGVLGILLAVPILGTLREFAEFLLKKIHGGNPYPDEAVSEIQ